MTYACMCGGYAISHPRRPSLTEESVNRSSPLANFPLGWQWGSRDGGNSILPCGGCKLGYPVQVTLLSVSPSLAINNNMFPYCSHIHSQNYFFVIFPTSPPIPPHTQPGSFQPVGMFLYNFKREAVV